MKNKVDNRESWPFDNSSSVKQLLDQATRQLLRSGSEVPGREARWLYCHASGMSSADLISRADHVPSDSVVEGYSSLVDRRISGEPLQYVLGEVEFRNVSLNVDPRVLIPRPETEMLVDHVVRVNSDKRPRVLDIGTGSGCIAIAIKSELPQAEVCGIDVSTGALEVAVGNAARNGLRVEFWKCDVLADACIEMLGHFDIIISNPPYVPFESLSELDRTVADYEPNIALTPGSDELLFYRRLAEISPKILSRGGMLVVEVHSPNAKSVATLFSKSGLHGVRVESDLAGKSRMVVATI